MNVENGPDDPKYPKRLPITGFELELYAMESGFNEISETDQMKAEAEKKVKKVKYDSPYYQDSSSFSQGG